MSKTSKKHGWLIDALADRGYMQKDLARAWDVDVSVASRFVSSGKPDITLERLGILARMIDVSREELIKRLVGENTPPPPQTQRPRRNRAGSCRERR
jgi:hypothetical protein